MAVDTWSNRFKNLLSNSWLLWKFSNLCLVLISKLNNLFISKSMNVISLNNSWKNWESMLNISSIIESIDKNTCNFNFVSRSGAINKIVEDIYLFLSWYSSWWNWAWSLLNCPFLVISVDTHKFFGLVLLTLANNTSSKELLHIILLIVHEWTLDILASETSIVRDFFLWENASSLGDDSSNFNESIKMDLSQIS